MSASNDDPTFAAGADTLLDVINEAAVAGYAGQFIARDSGEVECRSCSHSVNPAGMTVDHLHRFEGASDAADLSMIALAVCPSCGTGGVLIAGYGPNASTADAAVLPHLSVRQADSGPLEPTDEP